MNLRSSSPWWQHVLFGIFFLSGFSGLIYESVWSNYLKFFLGHAAYAQTLVLALYMGGMAAGAWLAGRMMHRLSNPLLAYAVVELIIGLFGLVFHSIFTTTSALVLDTILPGIESQLAIEFIRWGFAAILILPQTILLGATFPLMTAGILRCFPNTPGKSIAMLYFTNSIGAVFGVLLSGLVLVSLVGLPGTILTAALINILLASFVYLISKTLVSPPVSQADQTNQPGKAGQAAQSGTITAGKPSLMRPLLLISLITGLSSFIYEISWIRMLSMVLGASTHAFEFMLSAFILGLALGGLWLRKRIDQFHQPLQTLGIVQILMGLLALCSTLAYNSSFDFMAWMLSSFQRNDTGYILFNLTSHLIALTLMLPVTFMAGMTLPLITAILFREEKNEAVIGKVYAFNTLGAIIGVTLAAMLLLPMVGLKMTVMIGAALDLLLGAFLVTKAKAPRNWQFACWLLIFASLSGTQLAPEFDTLRMTSSVFRLGSVRAKDSGEIMLHRDGRTATVDVHRDRITNVLTLSTNGKPDASGVLNQSQEPSSDEPTQILLGGLPLLAKPDAQSAAVIGMGAGVSAHVLLASKQLQHLDVIEIEAEMIAGARMFGWLSERVFTDPRSHIHIDDAKSYFAAHKKRYDLIISEPSDSWVSGVSNLFTDEFYQRIQRHLTEDGLLVQWLHVYESSPALVASIFQALGNNFEDYRIYASNNTNLIILAKPKGKVAKLDGKQFGNPILRDAFKRVGWTKMDDIALHEVGDKALLEPLFVSSGAPVNSDFFPFVDQNAVKARFRSKDNSHLPLLHTAGVPIPGSNFNGNIQPSNDKAAMNFHPRAGAQMGHALARYLASGGKEAMPTLSPPLQMVAAILPTRPSCNDLVAQIHWHDQLLTLATTTLPYMNDAQAKPMLDFLKGQVCDSKLAQPNRELLQLMSAVSARDMAAIVPVAESMLGEGKRNWKGRFGYVTNTLLLAHFTQGNWEKANLLLKNTEGEPPFFAKLVAAHIRVNQQRQAVNK